MQLYKKNDSKKKQLNRKKKHKRTINRPKVLFVQNISYLKKTSPGQIRTKALCVLRVLVTSRLKARGTLGNFNTEAKREHDKQQL